MTPREKALAAAKLRIGAMTDREYWQGMEYLGIYHERAEQVRSAAIAAFEASRSNNPMTDPKLDPWNAPTEDEINATAHVVGNQVLALISVDLPIPTARQITKAAINAFLCLRRPAPSADAALGIKA